MAFKETKRKGFNFFRSYYDVYNELESNEDKLAFIDALLDRQFQGKKPENLTGMVKFAWISQVNSIDKQVKGYEDKTGTTLQHPTQDPCQGEVKRVCNPPSQQVQEKGQVQEEVKEEYIYRKFLHLTLSNDGFDKLIKLGYSKKQIDNILDEIENYSGNTNYNSLFTTCKIWLAKRKKDNNNGEAKMASPII